MCKISKYVNAKETWIIRLFPAMQNKLCAQQKGNQMLSILGNVRKMLFDL